MSLEGSGFEFGRTVYTVEFHDGSSTLDESVEAPQAAWLSVLEVTSAEWGGTWVAAETTLGLYNEDTSVTDATVPAGSATFLFESYWDSKLDDASGSASGGGTVSLEGSGFDWGSGGYSMEFHDGSDTLDESVDV